MKKLKSYKILKLSSSYLYNNNYNIDITYEQALKNKFIIAISESQLTRHLEQMENFITNPVINGENSKTITFIPDIISIQFDDSKIHTAIKNNCLKLGYGFTVNKKKYSRLATTSGAGRKQTSFFINNEIKEEIKTKIMNGLHTKDMIINPAKFNAYFGLCTSSSHVVSEPRVCVIGDMETPINITCDFVDTDCSVKANESMTVTKNCFDGQGLIDPEFAKIWKKDLDCDYLPFGWVIRQSFLKGAVFNFDFKRWADINKITTITDIYGKEYLINEIDIILTKSQFKAWKYYESWQKYIDCCKENGNEWAVTKVNLKKEEEYSTTNYQFIQTLNLSLEDIKSLCKYSVDEINGCFEDVNKAIELMPVKKGETIPPFIQALSICPEAINDPYISKEIWNNVYRIINDMLIGKVKVRGNYQFMIADPIAFVEWALHRDIDKVKESKGVLKENEYYSNYWLDRGVSQVSAIRSPNIHFSEHNLLNLVERNFWFKHLPMGIIYNIWGNDQIKHQGNDHDGDIVFSTNLDVMQNGIIPSNIIEFTHTKPTETHLTEKELFKADRIGFKINVSSTKKTKKATKKSQKAL